jgi:hypothetical protein
MYSVSNALRVVGDAEIGQRGRLILEHAVAGLFEGVGARRSVGRVPDLCELHNIAFDAVLNLAKMTEHERSQELVADSKLVDKLIGVCTALEREEVRLGVLVNASRAACAKARKPVAEASELLSKYYDLQFAIAQTKADIADETICDETTALLEMELRRMHEVNDKLDKDSIASATIEHETIVPNIEMTRKAYMDIDERHTVALLFSALVQHVLSTVDARPSLELAEARHAREQKPGRSFEADALPLIEALADAVGAAR